MTDRLDRLPEVADLVGRVPDADLRDCAHLLAITVLSIVDIDEQVRGVLTDALADARRRGTVAVDLRLAVGDVRNRCEHQAFAASRRADGHARDRAFRAARTAHCITFVIGAEGAADRTIRDNLREAVYEAAVATRGTAAVVGVLSRHAA
ncbi:hypothetical protein AAFP35_09025 [Gordonia sp. CPCC 206044]|uniref:hypothetical protein n=1 Tax=Gordonia sp. CPCC 206044 TaxID=3140793 RepID=UPI003AF3914B